MTAVLEAVTDCGVPACARSVKVVKWQLCGMHYQRAYNSGMLDAAADLADVHATVAEWVAPPRRASIRKPKPPKPDEQPTIESFLASTEHLETKPATRYTCALRATARQPDDRNPTMTEPVPPAENEGTEGLPADELPEDLEADELPAESEPDDGRRRPFNVGTLHK